MENVTEGTNTTEKTEASTRGEAVCSNGDEGSGDDPTVAEVKDVKATSEATPVSSSCRPLDNPPTITLDPPPVSKWGVPLDKTRCRRMQLQVDSFRKFTQFGSCPPKVSDSPSSSDVSSSKGPSGRLAGGALAFKLNPSRLSNPFVKTDGDTDSVNSCEPSESDDKTTSASSSNFTVAFVPLGASNSTIGGPPGGAGGGGLGDASTDASKTSDSASNLTSTVAADSTSVSQSPSSPAVSTTAAPITTASSSISVAAASSTNSAEMSSSSTTTTSSRTSSSSFSFVFGQNIRDKVEVVEAAMTDVNEPSSTTPDTKEVTANGTSTSEMLFSAQVKNTDKANDSGGKTLSEAAREYEEARNVKRKFEEVPVLTGEEEEANVLQVNCKLFAWNNNSWTERGRGTLRVNDFPNIPSQHRLIVRTAGSLRVVLNTKIWSGMTVDRASAKSMRITAMDSSGMVKVFLVMAGSKEMDQLQKCLDWRVNNLKKLADPTALKKTKVGENVTDKS